MRDEYTKLTTDAHIEACPVCGGKAALWRYSEDPEHPSTKAVMCEHGEVIGPQEGMVSEGCLLYMPPDDFYRATEREAVKFWNEFAKALTTLRAARTQGASQT